MYSFITINERYHITSYGNGWAYEVTCQNTGEILWFQDDSACQLQTDTNDFENEGAITEYFECLCE